MCGDGVQRAESQSSQDGEKIWEAVEAYLDRLDLLYPTGCGGLARCRPTSHDPAECSPILYSFLSSYTCSFIVLLDSLGTVPLGYQVGLCLWSRCCCRLTYRRGEQFGEDATLHVCFQVPICNEWYSTDVLYQVASLVMSSLSDPILNSHV